MYMTYVCRMFGLDDYQQILLFYMRVDADYFPRLSERRGGLEGHMQNIIQNGGSFALFEDNKLLEGAAGFFPLDQEKTIVQFTFFTFSERYRNTLAPYRLAKFLAQKREELGYGRTRRIIARTWYEASANRMERMGFNHMATIRDDLIPGRTSYYFEGDLSFIVENVMRRRTVKYPHSDFK
jgi:hypothetical protein